MFDSSPAIQLNQSKKSLFNPISFFRLKQEVPSDAPDQSVVVVPSLKVTLDKSQALLIKQKQQKHTLLYRLFHSEDESDGSVSTKRPSMILSDGDDSDYSSSCQSTPPLATPMNASQPAESLRPKAKARQKSSSHLMDFFKSESQSPNRKELPFLFKHLKHAREPATPANSAATLVDHTPSRTASEASLCEKYGWIEKGCVGRGANGVVRVSHKQDPACPTVEKLYAIKEFRKRNKNESEKSYIKKLTSEFCIGSALHHENVIETVDLIQNEQHQWCEVLEYCAGGDLCNLIQNKHLTSDEANTYFVQLIHGLAYIHSMGVAHRDLKPENLMLDAHGCLKITDFGEAEVFQSPYERSPHKSKRCCGSQPYMAPEEFIRKEFDPRPIDIFACGIIYLAMIYNRLPWKKPHLEDPSYRHYLAHLDYGFAMIDRLPRGARELIRQILHPEPEQRPTMEAIVQDHWFRDIEHLIDVKKKLREQALQQNSGVPMTPNHSLVSAA